MNEQEKKKILNRAGELLSLGRGIVKKRAPYIATTLYGLIPHPVWDPAVTIGVTPGLVLYFNPIWLLSDPELQDEKDGAEVMAACLYHECWHPLHGMHRIEALAQKGVRLGMSEREAFSLANVADDLSINYAERHAGWKLPNWVCYPEKFGLKGGLLMEEYWEELIKQQDSIMKQLQQHQAGQPSSGGQGEAGQKEGVWKPGPCSGSCGGAAGDPHLKDLEQQLDASIGRHKADQDRIRRTTVEEMQNHEARHGRGSVPGFRNEHFNFIKEKPLVQWERQFRHVLSRCTGSVLPGDDDYSMLRPDRHSALLGICLPGTIETEPEVAFIRDTSGSMGVKQLNHANNEIVHGMAALGVDRIWLLDADTQTHGKPRRVGIRDIPTLEVRGRGGTSFVQPLEAAARLVPRPDIVIYMTDGDGFAPDRKPREFEVIWCVVPSPYQHKPADWGHIVFCSNNRAEREKYAKSGKKTA